MELTSFDYLTLTVWDSINDVYDIKICIFIKFLLFYENYDEITKMSCTQIKTYSYLK